MTDGRSLKTSGEISEYLKIPIRTLDQWAWQGIGPRWSKVGRYRRYRLEDVDDWITTQIRTGAES